MAKTTYPVMYELPDEYCLLVGQFITRWAHLEWRIKSMMYVLLRIDPKLGRLVVQEPRVIDYITMVENVATIKGITVSVDWKKLRTIFGKIQSWRDWFAHGLWLDTGEPSIQIIKGKTVLKKGGPSYNARIQPYAMQVPPRVLRGVIRSVDAAVDLIGKMQGQIEQHVKPSREKHPRQLPPGRAERRLKSSSIARRRQPEPSQA